MGEAARSTETLIPLDREAPRSPVAAVSSMTNVNAGIDTHFCPYAEAPGRSYLISMIFFSALSSLVVGAWALACAVGWL